MNKISHWIMAFLCVASTACERPTDPESYVVTCYSGGSEIAREEGDDFQYTSAGVITLYRGQQKMYFMGTCTVHAPCGWEPIPSPYANACQQ